MGDRTRAHGRHRTRDYDQRARPRHHETRRPQSERERLRAKRARPTNEAAPQKGRPSQKKGKEKENVLTAKPSGMWTRDEASEAARSANPASEASWSGERSEPPCYLGILLFPSFQSCIEHNVDFVYIILEVVIQTNCTIMLIETMMAQEVDGYPCR